MPIELAVVPGDVATVEADLLLLKHAGTFHGADQQVAMALISRKLTTAAELHVPPGEAAVLETQGAIRATRVMFLGTPPLGEFSYREMRLFAAAAIETIAEMSLPVRTLASTVHGGGYGLDIEESLQALIYGFQQALSQHPTLGVERILFVERSARRVQTLTPFLADFCLPPTKNAQATGPVSPVSAASTPKLAPPVEVPRTAPPTPVEKQRCFVAMPFSDDFEDVYQLGIYHTARKCGYICERVDEAAFAGNIVEQIKHGISQATFVIADLTEARPNVYLEVGFAWGQGKKVILLARDGERLHFDVAQHKCLFYKNITRLNAALEKLILELFGPGGAA